MLVIRLSRTGRQNQASYRLVVAEHARPVKGKFLEMIGSYVPYEDKKLNFKKDRVEFWISKGAKPSDTVAGLLHKGGMKDMEKFMEPRTKKRASKDPEVIAALAAAAEAAKAPKVEEVAAEEPAVVEETPAETVAEEAPASEEAAA